MSLLLAALIAAVLIPVAFLLVLIALFVVSKPTFEWVMMRICRYKDVSKPDVGLYLRRFYLTPLGWPARLFLHHIVRSDDDRDPHDHPWNFTSYILAGAYDERIYYPGQRIVYSLPLNVDGAGEGRAFLRRARAGAVLENVAEHTHMVEIIEPVWSLVVAERGRRTWGFWVLDPDNPFHDQWIPEFAYLNRGVDASKWNDDYD